MAESQMAPPLRVGQWFNVDRPHDLAALRGQVVVLHAFQMLCPGCVSHGVPQAERVHRLFRNDGVTVVGLHSVFEHHAAMTPVALAAFLHEYRVTHPIGVDMHNSEDPVPITMRAYALEGTPSLMLIDRSGRLRMQHFGRLDDLVVGREVMRLAAEPALLNASVAVEGSAAKIGCTEEACTLPPDCRSPLSG
jgi:peroxiredoxin